MRAEERATKDDFPTTVGDLAAAQQDAELDAEARFRAKVSRLSNNEFQRWKSEEIARAEAAKARAKPAPRERSEEEERLNKMDSAEFADYMRSLGINTKLDTTLSDGMKRERKRRADGGQ